MKTYKYTVEQHWYRMRREVSPEPRDEHHWALADSQHFNAASGSLRENT
ncbi:MAG: hypothetical protein QW794_06995 [Thermosphaera sp.]